MNAHSIPCEILYRSTDEQFSESIRQFQGCPTIAVSAGGRIYLGWYSGGTTEPHMENYNLLVYSDDDGKTWSAPLLIIPSNKERLIHALDIQLWIDPSGALHVCWVQNDAKLPPETLPPYVPGQPLVVRGGHLFDDFVHFAWEVVCTHPDEEHPVFSDPVCWDIGFMRCKPLITASGSWLRFNYDQTDGRYGYSISDDNGKTVTHHYGAKKIGTHFDEGMAYQRKDGSIRLLARTWEGALAESISYDNGLTWTDAQLSDIVSADTRFFISRTPTGRILLVKNDHPKVRTNMTILLSEDDGATWKYSCCIDTRTDISYPDVDFHNGRIYLTYDRERTGAKEIYFLSFTEEDIIQNNCSLTPKIVSKP